MLQFGLRLPPRPRQMITTTPRPIPLIKRLLADPATVVTRATTRANAHNLSPAFLQAVQARYAGTRLGRQEIEAEILDDRPEALWSRALLEQCRVAAAPALKRIVVGVDPPASARRDADACGLVAAGIVDNNVVYVLADETVSGASPAAWAAKAITLWHRLEADALVVEVNQGGDMVRAVIREVDRGVPVIEVRARRGKYLRAEPVAHLYERGRVKHVGAFPALEDEMCDFALDGLSSGRICRFPGRPVTISEAARATPALSSRPAAATPKPAIISRSPAATATSPLSRIAGAMRADSGVASLISATSAVTRPFA
jgi:phage terminase large subunit-like protein